MTLRIIYDDTRVVPDEVVALAGVQQFSSIIFRRKSLLRYMTELAVEAGFQDMEVISRETTDAQLAATSTELRNSEKFLVFPSNVVAMAPRDEVITLLRKLRYAQNNLVLTVTPGVDWTGLVLLDGEKKKS